MSLSANTWFQLKISNNKRRIRSNSYLLMKNILFSFFFSKAMWTPWGHSQWLLWNYPRRRARFWNSYQILLQSRVCGSIIIQCHNVRALKVPWGSLIFVCQNRNSSSCFKTKVPYNNAVWKMSTRMGQKEAIIQRSFEEAGQTTLTTLFLRLH